MDAFALQRDAPASATVLRGRREWGRSADRFLSALCDGDERTAAEVVDRLHTQGESALDVLGRVVVPALTTIGEHWAAGQVSVAQEHRASEIATRLLAGIDQRRPGRPRGMVVVTAPPGELHGLPVQMAAAVLREDGWSVEMLGRDMPADGLHGFVATVAPDLVVLTVTTPSSADAAEAIARDSPPAATTSWWASRGGRSASWSRRRERSGPSSGGSWPAAPATTILSRRRRAVGRATSGCRARW